VQVCRYVAGGAVLHPGTCDTADEAMCLSGNHYTCICVGDGTFIKSSGVVNGWPREQLPPGQALRVGYNMPALRFADLEVCP
jgi:hypothetical protein